MTTQLLDRQIPWGDYGDVPNWAVDSESAALAGEQGSRSFILAFSGPAILLARRAFKETAWLFAASPVIAFIFSKPAPTMLAQSPPWMLPALGLVVIRLVWLEHKVRKVLLPAIANALVGAPPTVMGLKLPFKMWLALSTPMSVLAHLDIITSGVFCGRWIKTWFTGGADLFAMWAWTMDNSMVPVLAVVPFAAWVILGFILTSFQGGYAYLHSWPLQNKDICGDELNYRYQAPVPPLQAYNTRMAEMTNHAMCLIPLLEVTRMASIQNSFKTTIVKEILRDSSNRVQAPFVLGDQFEKMILKVALFSVFQSGYTLNIEVAGLGLARALSKNHDVDVLTLASIVIGLISGVYTVVAELKQAIVMAKHIKSTNIVEEFCDAAVDDEFVDYLVGLAGDAATYEEKAGMLVEQLGKLGGLSEVVGIIKTGLQKQRKLGMLSCLLMLVAIVYSFAAARAAYQTMAVLVCPSGLHDFGVGCVDLPGNFTSSA